MQGVATPPFSTPPARRDRLSRPAAAALSVCSAGGAAVGASRRPCRRRRSAPAPRSRPAPRCETVPSPPPPPRPPVARGSAALDSLCPPCGERPRPPGPRPDTTPPTVAPSARAPRAPPPSRGRGGPCAATTRHASAVAGRAWSPGDSARTALLPRPARRSLTAAPVACPLPPEPRYYP